MKKNHKKILQFIFNGDRIIESERSNGSKFYWFLKSKKNIPYQTFQALKSFLIRTNNELNSCSVSEYILNENIYEQFKKESLIQKSKRSQKQKEKLEEIKLSDFFKRHNLFPIDNLLKSGAIELNLDKIKNPNILVNKEDYITINFRHLEWKNA